MAEFNRTPNRVSEHNFDDEIRTQLATLKLHATREAEIAEELAQHADDRMRDLKSRGHSESAARDVVLKELREGNLASALVGVERGAIPSAIQLGKMPNARMIDTLVQDLRFAVRSLLRQPGFTIVAVLTLAIGIGANTAIFSVLRSVLLRPLPYPHAEQLVQVWSDHRQRGRAQPEWLAPPDFAEWRDQNRTFSGMAAYQFWGPDLTNPGDPESLTGVATSGNFLELLGARPSIGRLLNAADDNSTSERTVVISNALWKRRFGSDASIIGKQLTLSGTPWTVVGVLSPEFRPPLGSTAEIYRTLRRAPDAGCRRGCVVLRVIGRLKPDVSLTAAQSDLQRIANEQAKAYPETNGKVGAWLVPLHKQITGDTEKPLLAITGAVAFVLLIGCVNLANLLLVRGAGRARELGVRAALGAGQGRIVRQLLTENGVLASVGGALGLILGIVGSQALATLVPESTRSVQAIHMDTQVLMFAVGVTLLSALMFGLLPALYAARSSLMLRLRGGSRETGRHGNQLRSTLVVAQLSLAVVLLVGAGLLMRSFLLMQRVDLGYRSSGVVMMSVAFPSARYPDAARALTTIEDLQARLRANPEFASVAVADVTPLSGGDQDIGVLPVGGTPPRDLPPSIWYRAVTNDYLQTMRMRIVAGRAFTAEDRAGGQRVGIINEEAARLFFPGQNAIGRALTTGPDSTDRTYTVIGVVASSRHDGPNQPYKSEMYVPLSQSPSRGVTFALEPARDAAAATNAFRRALHDVDPLVPVSTTARIDDLVSEAVALPKMYATMVGAFAATALLLAVLGVYGVMAYAVAQRQREIGVRLALGAAPASIRRMVLMQGGKLAVVGVVAGSIGALALGRLIASLLFNVSTFDVPTFAIAGGVLGGMAIVAAWLPARRAMRVDPLVAIRQE